MQNLAKAELKNAVVESFHIDLDSDYEEAECELRTTGKAELRVPKEENDPTFLMAMTMNVVSQEPPGAVSIKIVTTFYFELDQLVEDYDEIVREQCLPAMQEWQKKMVNKLVADMGYPKIYSVSKEKQ